MGKGADYGFKTKHLIIYDRPSKGRQPLYGTVWKRGNAEFKSAGQGRNGI